MYAQYFGLLCTANTASTRGVSELCSGLPVFWGFILWILPALEVLCGPKLLWSILQIVRSSVFLILWHSGSSHTTSTRGISLFRRTRSVSRFGTVDTPSTWVPRGSITTTVDYLKYFKYFGVLYLSYSWHLEHFDGVSNASVSLLRPRLHYTSDSHYEHT